ncbi:MAG: dockerin type I repeat-containing protein [Ruminococcus sp.]|nr:dockerin type I repeat-containing protein [Ruminococcus sp.]
MKKLISLCLVIIIMLSVAIVGVSAKETEPHNVLHFDTNTAAHWDEEFEKVYCHIWEYGKDSFFNWQSRREKCTDEDGDGIWTYNLDDYEITLEDGKIYACIFSNEHGKQTYNLIFDKTVLGDTAYCDGDYFDSPESIKYYNAYWRNQDKELDGFGPELYITSDGFVVGTCIPSLTTASEIFEEFLVDSFEYAGLYTGQSDQTIIDNIAVKLEFTVEDVVNSLHNTEVYAQWSWYNSPVEMGGYTPLKGDVDGDTYLNILDATTIQRYESQLTTLCDKALANADMDGDNVVSVLDATIIQKELSQLS